MRGLGHRRRWFRSTVVFAVTAAMWGIAPAGAVSRPLATVKPAITSGRLHSCGLTAEGTVDCWGDNSYGELGNNSILQPLVPVRVHGVGNVGFLEDVTAVTAGNGFSCALLAAKSVDCWGYGGDGELGTPGPTSGLVPVEVHGVGNHGFLSGVTAITAGNGFACALLAAGTVDCWGDNSDGELGTNSTRKAALPVNVRGVGDHGLLSGVTAISAGSGRTPCALLVGKSVVCWGANTNGELGNNSTGGQLVPVKVHGVDNVGFLGGVKAITGAGTDSSCALMVGGTVDCWGYNGSLGINSPSGNSLTPVQVVGVGNVGFLNGVAAVADHSDAPCALLTSGGVDCWGFGTGDKLGNGTDASGAVPLQVRAPNNDGYLVGAIGISSGQQSSCALLAGGAVDCWGANANGELGDNSTNDSSISVPVTGIGNIGVLKL
jgi:alpha-tubulin suppressor-like RCC1 family protein